VVFQFLETFTVRLVFGKWVFGVCRCKWQKVICDDDSASFLHDPIRFGSTCLIDAPIVLIMYSLYNRDDQFLRTYIFDSFISFLPLLSIKFAVVIFIKYFGDHIVLAIDVTITIEVI
jgi:hypothetical protein